MVKSTYIKSLTTDSVYTSRVIVDGIDIEKTGILNFTDDQEEIVLNKKLHSNADISSGRFMYASRVDNTPDAVVNRAYVGDFLVSKDELVSVQSGGGILNGIGSLTTDEVAQLANINTINVSNSNWNQVSKLNQDVSSTASPSFFKVSVVGAPSQPSDLSNKGYIDAVVSNSRQDTDGQIANISATVDTKRNISDSYSKQNVDLLISGRQVKNDNLTNIDQSLSTTSDALFKSVRGSLTPVANNELTSKKYVDDSLSTKADASAVNNKVDATNVYQKSETYNKSESNTLLSGKLDQSTYTTDKAATLANINSRVLQSTYDTRQSVIDASIAGKVLQTTYDSRQTVIDNSLSSKAPQTTTFTKDEVTALLQPKLDQSTYLSNKTTTDTAIAGKTDNSVYVGNRSSDLSNINSRVLQTDYNSFVSNTNSTLNNKQPLSSNLSSINQNLNISDSPVFNQIQISSAPNANNNVVTKAYADNIQGNLNSYIVSNDASVGSRALKTQADGIQTNLTNYQTSNDTNVSTRATKSYVDSQDATKWNIPSNASNLNSINQNMGTSDSVVHNKVTISSAPSAASDASRKDYVDAVQTNLSNYQTSNDTNVSTRATKSYVDSQDATKWNIPSNAALLNGINQDVSSTASPTFNQVTVNSTPSSGSSAASKTYVDSVGIAAVVAGTGLTKSGSTLSVNASQPTITSLGVLNANTYITQSLNGRVEFALTNSGTGNNSFSLLGLRNDVSSMSLFLNNSTRTNDSGGSAGTLRNDAGSLNLLSSGNKGLRIVAGDASFDQSLTVTGNLNTSAINSNNVMTIRNDTATSSAFSLSFVKSRTNATVNINDELGYVQFSGFDTNSNQRRAAYIISSATAIGGTFVSGNMQFSTTNAAGNAATRMTLTSEGDLNLNNSLSVSNNLLVSGISTVGPINSSGNINASNLSVIGTVTAPNISCPTLLTSTSIQTGNLSTGDVTQDLFTLKSSRTTAGSTSSGSTHTIQTVDTGNSFLSLKNSSGTEVFNVGFSNGYTTAGFLNLTGGQLQFNSGTNGSLGTAGEINMQGLTSSTLSQNFLINGDGQWRWYKTGQNPATSTLMSLQATDGTLKAGNYEGNVVTNGSSQGGITFTKSIDSLSYMKNRKQVSCQHQFVTTAATGTVQANLSFTLPSPSAYTYSIDSCFALRNGSVTPVRLNFTSGSTVFSLSTPTGNFNAQQSTTPVNGNDNWYIQFSYLSQT